MDEHIEQADLDKSDNAQELPKILNTKLFVQNPNKHNLGLPAEPE
jgi:hypothetical protein